MNAKPYQRDQSRIVFSTEARGLQSHAPRARQTPAELKATAEMVGVVKNQPHRRGSDDPRLSEPLGRFCASQWLPHWVGGRDLNLNHREDMYRAGAQYADIVHKHRVLMGLGAGGRTESEGLSCALTDEQIKANLDAAKMRREEADGALRQVHGRAVSAMARLCVDAEEPRLLDADLSKSCLWALAIHFGIQKLGFNSGKSR